MKAKMVKGLARTAMFAERLLRNGHNTDPASIKSVLILEYRLPLGCCVHLTPLYEAIKRCRPEVELVVSTCGIASRLLRHNPYIDRLIETPDTLVDTPGAIRELRRQLQRGDIHPDCVFTGASDRRTRIALLAFLSGPFWRGGYTLTPQLYTKPLHYDPSSSLIENNLRLAALAGCSTQHREPTAFFSGADVAAARAMIEEVNPTGKPLLVMVTQNSGGQSTGWHSERFVDVARIVSEDLGCALAYVGTSADAKAIQDLRAAANGTGFSLAGRTSVTQLSALLAMSDYLVSLDTGTMHLGRAVGLPLVVIAPSWQKPHEWLPLGLPQARVLRGPDQDRIPPGYRLDEVASSDVIGALHDLMAAYPASPESRASRIANGLSSIDNLR